MSSPPIGDCIASYQYVYLTRAGSSGLVYILEQAAALTRDSRMAWSRGTAGLRGTCKQQRSRGTAGRRGLRLTISTRSHALFLLGSCYYRYNLLFQFFLATKEPRFLSAIQECSNFFSEIDNSTTMDTGRLQKSPTNQPRIEFDNHIYTALAMQESPVLGV